MYSRCYAIDEYTNTFQRKRPRAQQSKNGVFDVVGAEELWSRVAQEKCAGENEQQL
jgi:hypothetical protein